MWTEAFPHQSLKKANHPRIHCRRQSRRCRCHHQYLEEAWHQRWLLLRRKYIELYPDVVKRLLDEGHFVGSHSYGHLLYMPWEDRDSLLVTHEEFENDMIKATRPSARQVSNTKTPSIFLLTNTITRKYLPGQRIWVLGFFHQLSPGTVSNADYTTPDMGQNTGAANSSTTRLWRWKKRGLNGHLMLIHFGTDDRRTDKFYNGYLDKMIKTLKRKGYTFVPVREAVGI